MLVSSVEPPKPGSRDAALVGCSCPVMDNHNGEGFPIFEDGQRMTGYWISADCPVHGVKAKKAEIRKHRE